MQWLLLTLALAVGCDPAAGLTKEYIYNKTALKWDEAQNFCRDKYRDLATIANAEENRQAFEAGLITSGWIGLRKMPSGWEWSDGEPASFFEWYSDPQQAECAYAYQYSNSKGLWQSTSCGDLMSFYCYQYLILVKEKKTWEEAQDFCRSSYTGLAVMTSGASLRQMKLEMGATETEGVWTGLRFRNQKWLWVNEEQPDYQQALFRDLLWGVPWGLPGGVPGLPGGLALMPSCPDPSYRCGAFSSVKNAFENHHCNEKLNFICSWA